MRATAPLLALVLTGALFAMPTAAAEPQLTDASGDVEITIDADTPLPGVPLSHEEMATVDLLSLEGVETEDAIGLRVGVAGMSTTASSIWNADYLISFGWNDKDYRVQAWLWPASQFGDGGSFAYLQMREGDEWDWVAELGALTVDTTASTFTVDVPKVYLSDSLRRIPGRGDAIVDLSVIAESSASFGLFSVRMMDAMPDKGAQGSIVMQLGDFSTGDLILTTPERVRVSNGGATTFVYPVTVRNSGDAEHEFRISVSDVPEGWTTTFQSPVRVPANSERIVSLLASVPFAHEHGGFDAFNVSVESARDAQSAGRLRLGVVHTPIPQPAAHHSELYLHTEADEQDNALATAFSAINNFRWGWMNTVSDHAADGPGMSPNGRWDGDIVWWVNLNPSLQVGLDFDIERMGELVGSFEGKRSGETSVSANLFYYRDSGGGGESVLLAEGEPMTITLSDSAPTSFSIPLTPQLESDYIAFARDSYLYLEIHLDGTALDNFGFFGAGPTTPVLRVEDFKLSLPLNEYHDRLTGAADVAQAVEITAVGLVEKAGRPGTTLTYSFDVKNLGSDTTYIIDLAGNDADMATVVPGGAISFAAGETKRVTLGMEIPVGATDAQEIEILLFVHGQDDPSRMAIARTKTLVVTSGEAAPDESAELLAAQAANRETPSAGLLLALASIAVALAARKVRRQ